MNTALGIATFLAAIATVAAVVVAILIGIGVIDVPSPAPTALSSFEKKLLSLNWIAYEPVNFDPGVTYPTEDQILEELETLRGTFNGIITFGNEETLASIPRLAQEIGCEGVIMGIYDPDDESALALAIKQAPYVDGYSIGHNGLFPRDVYSLTSLIDAIKKITEETEKPVSTTEYLADYEDVARKVAPYVGWLFPDTGGTWRGGALRPTIWLTS